MPQAIRALAQGGTERLIGVQRSESKMCRCTLNLGCNGIGDVGAESLAGVLGFNRGESSQQHSVGSNLC